MANLRRQTDRTVWIEIRLPREAFDALGLAYGGRNRALGVLRESLPDFVDQLLQSSPPASTWADIGHGLDPQDVPY